MRCSRGLSWYESVWLPGLDLVFTGLPTGTGGLPAVLIRAFKFVSRRLRLSRDPVGFARDLGVTVGAQCRFIGVDQGTFGSEPYLVSIGDHVTLTAGVVFLTHDGGVWVFRDYEPDIERVAPIRIGNNVFIGINSLLLPGVSIGNNCVIGAGSVVSHSIPDNHVAVGVPCRPIKTLADYRASIDPRVTHSKGLSKHDKRKLFETQISDG